MALKRALIFILVVSTAALLVSEAFAGGYSVAGIGARARSMAGAFRAVADDWSAMYYNPAGLARMEQSQFNFTLDLNSYRPTFNPQVTLNDYDFGYTSGERYPDDIIINFPNFSLVTVAPFGFPITAAFGVFEPYDENLRWDLYRFVDGYGQPSVNLPNIDYQYNLDILDFHPTIATSFADDQFHVGVGLSIRKGNLLTNQIFLVPGDFGDFPVARPYDRLVKWGVVDVSGFGFGANVGLLYELSEQISIGATYQTKTKISMDGDVVTRFYSPDNDAIQTGQGREIDTMFSGFTFEATHEADVDMTLPSEFGFGLAFNPSEYVTVAADLVFTRWSEFEDIEVMLRTSRGPQGIDDWPIISDILMNDIVYPYGRDDAMRVSFGIEGQPSDAIKLRGGYSYDQSPVPDKAANPLITDTGDRHHLTSGISLFHKNFEFAATGGFSVMPERDVDELSDVNDDGIWDNLSGTYGNSAFNTSFSITVKF